jgi:hypothetical protein
MHQLQLPLLQFKSQLLHLHPLLLPLQLLLPLPPHPQQLLLLLLHLLLQQLHQQLLQHQWPLKQHLLQL